MKKATWFLSLLLLLPAMLWAQTAQFNDVNFRQLPALSVGGTQGVAAAYAGTVGDAIIVAGGCNFPDAPAAEGGAKVFYKDIFAFQKGAWTKVG